MSEPRIQIVNGHTYWVRGVRDFPLAGGREFAGNFIVAHGKTIYLYIDGGALSLV